MTRLRTLFAAALAAGLVALAPPSFAQDDAPADAPAEAMDADADAAGADADGSEEAEADEATAEDGDAAAGDTGAPADDAGAEDDVELEETPSPWSSSLMMSMAAMCIGGFSAVLGIWVDRDTSRPTVFAYSMSFLILCALLVGVSQAYLDEVDGIKKDQDLERMLDMTYEIAVSSGDPELIKLVEKTSGEKIDVPPPAPEPVEAPSEEGAEDGADDAEGTDGDGATGDEATPDDGEAPEGDAATPAE